MMMMVMILMLMWRTSSFCTPRIPHCMMPVVQPTKCRSGMTLFFLNHCYYCQVKTLQRTNVPKSPKRWSFTVVGLFFFGGGKGVDTAPVIVSVMPKNSNKRHTFYCTVIILRTWTWNDESTRTSNHPVILLRHKTAEQRLRPTEGADAIQRPWKTVPVFCCLNNLQFIFFGTSRMKQWLIDMAITWIYQEGPAKIGVKFQIPNLQIFCFPRFVGFGVFLKKWFLDHLFCFIISTKTPAYDTKYTNFMLKKLDFYWHPRKDLLNRVICVCVWVWLVFEGQPKSASYLGRPLIRMFLVNL